MTDVELQLDENGFGHFYIAENGERLGEMEISISGPALTAYHTEVSEKANGKGFGKKLFSAMVEHARKNGLKVTALCPFVHAQFKRHADEYADVWNRDNDE